MKYEEIFRDTKNWYKIRSNYVSENLIDFAVEHAGDTILDAGCATGEYIQRLSTLGYHCVGADVNSEYIDMAKQKNKSGSTLGENLSRERLFKIRAGCFGRSAGSG